MLDKFYSKITRFLNCTRDHMMQNVSLQLAESLSTNSRTSSKANSLCEEMRIEYVETIALPPSTVNQDDEDLIADDNMQVTVTDKNEENVFLDSTGMLFGKVLSSNRSFLHLGLLVSRLFYINSYYDKIPVNT
jgi:hypothetical protein